MKPWFYNEQSITEFKEPVAYKGLEINVRKTNVKPPYIATVKSPATGKEVIQKGGNTEQEALDSAKQAVDKREADAPKISAGGQTSLLFNTPSNDELLKDPSAYNDFYAKISKDSNGPTLVIGNEIYGAADLEADGFRKSGRRNPDKAGEDALPQVAVNASNKTLSQMGIKMNGRYTMDIEGKYEDDKGHTVYPLQFQSSTIHAGDKERMKRPGLTIGMKREDVEPWFQREFEEAEIIKFPEPVKNVVELPNVQSYPDFLTGVKDLHNRRDRGEISQDSHDKLYADLIQRFMRKESFETPWFLREAPADQGIMSTQAATDFKSLAQQVSKLPADTDPRIIDKIVSAIELARAPKSKKGSRQDAYTRIKDPLKKVGEVDSDMKKAYRYVAKQMLGNNLTSDEIFKQIIPAIQQDKCIILDELTALRSDLSKIIPTYKLSKQTAFFYTDLLMTQPGQGVGPGEILFSVFSQSIKKGGKGDLTLKSGKGIEVKGADEASGSGAGRMRDSDLEKVRKPEYDKLVANFLKKFPTKNVSGIGLGKAGIMGLMMKFPAQRNFLIDSAVKLFDALFPEGGYANEFRQALEADDVKKAEYYYGLSNMQQYNIVKASTSGQDQAYLFVDTSNSPATTTYVDSYADALAGLNKGILRMKIAGSPYIVAKPGRTKEAYPKVSLYPVK
jgi:hypothetical protein